MIYNPTMNVSQALERMRAEVTTPSGQELIAFIEAPSERGILK